MHDNRTRDDREKNAEPFNSYRDTRRDGSHEEVTAE